MRIEPSEIHQVQVLDINSLKNRSTYSSLCREIVKEIVELAIFRVRLRDGLHQFRLLIKRHVASRYEQNLLSEPSDSLPNIEVVINSTDKDFKHLFGVISFAKENSINPINKISVVVPEKSIFKCKQLLVNHPFHKLITVISEDSVLSLEQRQMLKETFKEKYGWILQQFLTLSAVLESNSAGVLQVNSDTYILRPQCWVDERENQVLMVSSEYHKPYYQLLRRLNEKYPVRTQSHITHHMLFQPKILKSILDRCGVQDLTQLIKFVIENYDKNQTSFACIEFELYALGANIYFKNKMTYSKFANLPVEAPAGYTISELQEYAKLFSPYYNSISMHSYLG